MTKTKLKIEKLELYYSSFRALDDVYIDIPANHITAVIGPSGCGKSTFLRTINRMNDLIPGVKVNGKILVDGINLLDIDVIDLRKMIGMVFQKPNPFPQSIFDNVAYGPRVHGVSDKSLVEYIAEQSLRDAALWDEVKDQLGESALSLSSGQQQRLCIARALAVKPEIILMDEPASALDPIATLAIEELMQILKEKYTIIIVTHNMQQAARVSDFTGFFHMRKEGAGYLVEFDETTKLFTNPSVKLTEDYITGRFG